MKKRVWILVCLCVLVYAGSAGSATEAGGQISRLTTWEKKNSPYVVKSNLYISYGGKLVIEPGVTVSFDRGSGIAVHGELVARGTERNPILFTSSQSTYPSEADALWEGIEFYDSSIDTRLDREGNYRSGSIIEYATIKYGRTGITVTRAEPIIRNSTITLNSPCGIFITSASPLIDGNTISSNASDGETGGGILLSKDSSSRITNNTITGNSTVSYAGGIGIEVYEGTPTIENNTISDNSSGAFGGGIGVYQSSAVIRNNMITGNSAVKGGGIYTDYGYGHTVILESNTVDANSAEFGGGLWFNDREAAEIIKNAFINNRATKGGGGVGFWCYPRIFENNTMMDNSASEGSNLYNSGSFSIAIPNNYWGSLDTEVIAESIHDFTDNEELGLVTYEPVSTGFPHIDFSVATLPATNVSDTRANFNIAITPNYAATFYFEYGRQSMSESGYEFEFQTASTHIDASVAQENVFMGISGLIPDTDYFYRAVADNGRDTLYGEIVTFKTAADADGDPDPDPEPVVCKIKIQGLTVSGIQEVNAVLGISADVVTNCADTPLYYRFSVHPDYGTDEYDGRHWASMTETQWVDSHTIDYVFDTPGKYIVVVWITSDPENAEPNGIPTLGWSVDIDREGEEPAFED